MNEYHFLDENTELTKSDLIRKYNSLIEDIWLLQHTVRELDGNYELMLNAYKDVADKLCCTQKQNLGALHPKYNTGCGSS